MIYDACEIVNASKPCLSDEVQVGDEQVINDSIDRIISNQEALRHKQTNCTTVSRFIENVANRSFDQHTWEKISGIYPQFTCRPFVAFDEQHQFESDIDDDMTTFVKTLRWPQVHDARNKVSYIELFLLMCLRLQRRPLFCKHTDTVIAIMRKFTSRFWEVFSQVPHAAQCKNIRAIRYARSITNADMSGINTIVEFEPHELQIITAVLADGAGRQTIRLRRQQAWNWVPNYRLLFGNSASAAAYGHLFANFDSIVHSDAPVASAVGTAGAIDGTVR